MILSEKLSDSTSVWTPLTVPAPRFDLAGKGSALTESPTIVDRYLGDAETVGPGAARQHLVFARNQNDAVEVAVGLARLAVDG